MFSADSANHLSPDFDVLINGAPLPIEARMRLIDITVEDDANVPGMFVLEFTGSDDKDGETVWIDNEPLFAVGHVVEIKIGYAGNLRRLIVGEITGLEPEFIFDRQPSLRVRGYDRRHRLNRGRKTRTFVQLKDSDIAEQIARQVGLTAQVVDTLVTHDYVVQANQSDMDFLQERARRIQYEVLVEDKTLSFRPVSNAAGEVLTLAIGGGDLLEFYPRLSAARQVSEVVVRGWSAKDKEGIRGRAAAGDEVSRMGGRASGAAISESAFGAAVATISDRPVMSQAEADQLAKARFNDVALALVMGEGVCRGRSDLRAGQVIRIDGVGRRFGGQYYVTAASHRYRTRDGYHTHFTVRRNAS